jgi:thioredoxin 1
MIMTKLMISVLIGGGLGALLGYFGKCSSGACPLTANPWRGAIYGALLGGLFYYVSGGSSPASMNKSTANIKLIKEGEFDAEVVQSSLPVVVDFYTTWCGPCKLLAPMLDELAGPLANQVKFVKINVDEAPALSQRFDIQAIPTLIFFKNGKVADKLIGLPSKDTLKTHLDSLAGPGSPAKNSG